MAAKPVPQMSTSASCSGPVGGAHAAGLDPADRLGHDVDVVAVQRGVPVVGEQQPLAADLVVGHQPARSSASRTWRRRWSRHAVRSAASIGLERAQPDRRAPR